MDPSGAPRKTLDDIRRELEAEYPRESESADIPVAATSDTDDADAEQHSSVAPRRRLGRRHAVAALVGVAVPLVVVAGYVVVTRERVRDAVASAPDVSAPKARAPEAPLEPRAIPPPAPTLPAASVTDLTREVQALRRELKALADKLEQSGSRVADMDSRVQGMESRVQGVESSFKRLAASAAPAAVSAAEAPPRQTRLRPAPVSAVAPAAAPVAASDSVRWIPPRHPAMERSPEPNDVQPVAEVVPLPPPPPAPTAREAAPPPAASAASQRPPTFWQKVDADWRTIKRGFASASDDFKAAVRDLTRNVTGE